jgi:hypothetical protein
MKIRTFLGIFLILFALKLFLIDKYGNATPYWDQWDAEAALLYLPWTTGDLTLSALFKHHNEHRIFMGRILALIEFELNGNIWDPLFQMVINAVLHLLSILILVLVAARELHWKASRPLALFTMFLVAVPFGWENTLCGFQSHFYFVILFSLASLAIFLSIRPLSLHWWAGGVLLAMSSFSLASGFLAALAIACVYIMRMLLEKKISIRGTTAIMLMVSYAIVCFMDIPNLEHHKTMKAHDPLEFITAFAKCLAFPFYNQPSLSLAVYSPVILWFALCIARPVLRENQPWQIIGILAWVALNAAAAAYGRGAVFPFPSSRYMDIFAIGLLGNFSLLLHLTLSYCTTLTRTFAIGWVALMLIGVFLHFDGQVLEEIRYRADAMLLQESNTKYFLTDFDRGKITTLPYFHLPYPSAQRLADILEEPQIRSILPENLRSPLETIASEGVGFVTDGYYPTTPARIETIFSSYGAQGNAQLGRIILNFDKPSRGGWLKIPVAGYPFSKKMRLYAESMDGKQLADLIPSHNPRESWYNVHIKTPDVPFRIVAEDNNSQFWFAFSLPVETGPATLITESTINIWSFLFSAGLFLLFFDVLYPCLVKSNNTG